MLVIITLYVVALVRISVALKPFIISCSMFLLCYIQPETTTPTRPPHTDTESMLKGLSRLTGFAGYALQYACWTHVTFEYVGDLVCVSLAEIAFCSPSGCG